MKPRGSSRSLSNVSQKYSRGSSHQRMPYGRGASLRASLLYSPYIMRLDLSNSDELNLSLSV